MDLFHTGEGAQLVRLDVIEILVRVLTFELE
jgi:hypothetical protein